MPRDGLRQRKPTSTSVVEPAPTKQRSGRRKEEEPRSSLSSIETLSPTTVDDKTKKTRGKKKKKTDEASSFSSVATTVSSTFSDVVKEKRHTKKKSGIENISTTTSVSTKVTDKQNDSCVTSSSLFSDMCAKYKDLLADNNENLAVYGLLYGERYQSFIQGQWPYADDRELTYNPHHLAMAGFVFLSKEPPTARCFVCFEMIECLNENDCDPWLKHVSINSSCDYIKLGYPSGPDAFTMSNALSLCEAAWTNKLGKLAILCEKYVLESLKKIAENDDDFD